MRKSKIVFVASLALAAGTAFADAGDVHINDWAAIDNGGQSTRAKVEAELREAQRLGLLTIGDGDLPVATAEQEAAIEEAGRQADRHFAMSSEAEG